MRFAKVEILLVGTDPGAAQCGISMALGGHAQALASIGVRHRLIPSHSRAPGRSRFSLWLPAALSLWRAVRSDRRAGIQAVVYAHAGALPSMLRKFSLLALAKAAGARTILQLHSVELDGYLGHPLFKRVALTCLSAADVVCVLTPWWAARLEDAGVEQPLCVVPNPLPHEPESSPTRVQPGKLARDPESPIEVLTLSRLVPGKGVDTAIQAMAHLPPTVHLVIAGDGSARARYEQLTKDLGLESRVSFKGWVSAEQKEQAFASADIFCLPTTYDSFGVPFIEAMSHGLPVVAVNFGPIADVVPHGKAGLLVSMQDAWEVANAIRALCDAAFRQQAASHALAWVRETFGSAVVNARLLEIVDGLVTGSATPRANPLAGRVRRG